MAKTATDFIDLAGNPAETIEVTEPGTLTYEVTIQNTGNVTLTELSIDDPLVDQLLLETGDDDADGQVDVGETWTLTGTYEVRQLVIDGGGIDWEGTIEDSGVITNKVTVDFYQTEPQEAMATVPVVQSPSLTVDKEADVDQISRPGPITYTITVRNTGNVTLTEVEVTDPLLGASITGPPNQRLEVGQTWIDTGVYDVTQPVIDGKGVDAYGTIDGDGDIDNVVTVTSYQLPDQTDTETVRIGEDSCTLRAAIMQANARPGDDTIIFDIGGPYHPGESGPIVVNSTGDYPDTDPSDGICSTGKPMEVDEANGVYTIQPGSPLPAITETLIVDGTSQPGYADHPVIEVDGMGAGDAAAGFTVDAGQSAIVGLAIQRFSGSGILIQSDGNRVEGNVIGTDVNGSPDLGNGAEGVRIAGGANNTIGGLVPAAGNVISGNGTDGVLITGSTATGNRVLGNRIGTTPDGDAPLANAYSGVTVRGMATFNQIGSREASGGNLISGNNGGVMILGEGTNSNVVLGNLVGTNQEGDEAVPNGIGIWIDSGGQLSRIEGNVISGNALYGVFMFGEGADNNLVVDNLIGTNQEGEASLPNYYFGVAVGYGQGNRIEGNVISGNTHTGVMIYGSGADNNVVTDNQIGTNRDGDQALPNQAEGVRVGMSARSNRIEGNVISGNALHGVAITGTDDNIVAGNWIGTDRSGTAEIGNQEHGVLLGSWASGNRIGSDGDGAGDDVEGNVIAFNGQDGVSVERGTSNSILGNSIFDNGGLGIDLGSDGVTPNDADDTDDGGNQLQNYPILTSWTTDGEVTEYHWTLTSTPNTTFRIECFANPRLDPSGFGEGQQYLDSIEVTTDSNGDATFSREVAPGEVITTTATDPNGNTSEFSAGIAIDLAVAGLTEKDEDTIGAVMDVNDNYDEDNHDTDGQPVPDHQPDATHGHRILGSADPQLVPATLTVFGYNGLDGDYTLTFSDKIKVWVEAPSNVFTEVVSGASVPVSIGGIPHAVDLWIEGMAPSETAGDVELKASFTPQQTAFTVDDAVKLTVEQECRLTAMDDYYQVIHGRVLEVPSRRGVLANDVCTPRWNWLDASVEGDSPEGLVTLDSDGGFLFVAPDETTPPSAPITFTYRADDGEGQSSTATVHIDVLNSPPALTESDASFQVHHDSQLLVFGEGLAAYVADADNDELTFQVVGATPEGLELAEDGTFTFDPAGHDVGAVSFQYTAADGATNGGAEVTTAVGTATIQVTNTQPEASNRRFVVRRGESLTIDHDNLLLTARDPDQDALSVVQKTDPQSGTITLVEVPDDDEDDSNNRFTFQYEANDGFAGTDAFQYAVDDGAGESQEFTVEIEVLNARPVAFDDFRAKHGFGPFPDIELPAWDADEDVLTVQYSQPEHGSVTYDAGHFTYTPDETRGFFTEDSFTFTVNDGYEDSEEATIDIVYTNIKPLATDLRVIIDKEASFHEARDYEWLLPSGNLAGLVTDGDDDLVELVDTYAAPQVGQFGTLTIRHDGSWRYDRHAQSDEPSGTDTFHYRVTDGYEESEEYDLTIVFGNTPPTAVAQQFEFPRNNVPSEAGPDVTTVTYTLNLIEGADSVTGVSDYDGDSVRLPSDTPAIVADQYRVDFQEGGQTVITAEETFAGEINFEYVVTDGYELSSPAPVTVRILNHDPAALDDLFLLGPESESREITFAELLGNDYDLDPNDANRLTVHFDAQTLAASPNWDLGPDHLTFAPAPGFIGTDSIPYWVTDPAGVRSEDATVTVEVFNAAPWAIGRPYQLKVGESPTANLIGTETVDGFSFGVSWDIEESNLTASIDGAPTEHNEVSLPADEPGAYTVEYDVSDGHLTSRDGAKIAVEVVPDLGFTVDKAFTYNAFDETVVFADSTAPNPKEFTRHIYDPTPAVVVPNVGPVLGTPSEFPDVAKVNGVIEIFAANDMADHMGESFTYHTKTVPESGTVTFGQPDDLGVSFTYTPTVPHLDGDIVSFEYEVRDPQGVVVGEATVTILYSNQGLAVSASVEDEVTVTTNNRPVRIVYDETTDSYEISPDLPSGVTAGDYHLSVINNLTVPVTVTWSGDVDYLEIQDGGGTNQPNPEPVNIGTITSGTVPHVRINTEGSLTADITAQTADVTANGGVANVTATDRVIRISSAHGDIGSIHSANHIYHVDAQAGSVQDVTSDLGSVGVVFARDGMGGVSASAGSILELVSSDGDIQGMVTAWQDIGHVTAQNIAESVWAQNGSTGRIDAVGNIGRDGINTHVGGFTSAGAVVAGQHVYSSVHAFAGNIDVVRAGTRGGGGSLTAPWVYSRYHIGEIDVQGEGGPEHGNIGSDDAQTWIYTPTGYIGNISANRSIYSRIFTGGTHEGFGSIGTIQAGRMGKGNIWGSIESATSVEQVIAQDGFISASIEATGDIGPITADGSITGDISGRNVFGVYSRNGSIAGVSATESIGDISAARDITGDIQAQTGGIGKISAGGATPAGSESYIWGRIEAQESIYEVQAGDASGLVIDKTETTEAFKAYMDQFRGWLEDPDASIDDKPVPPELVTAPAPDALTHIRGDIQSTSGTIGQVVAAGNIESATIAGNRLRFIGAAGDIGSDENATIEASEGFTQIATTGRLNSDVQAKLGVHARAIGDVEGDVTSSDGVVVILSSGSFTGNVDAKSDSVLQVYGDVGQSGAASQVNSHEGRTLLQAIGDVAGDITSHFGPMITSGGELSGEVNVVGAGTAALAALAINLQAGRALHVGSSIWAYSVFDVHAPVTVGGSFNVVTHGKFTGDVTAGGDVRILAADGVQSNVTSHDGRIYVKTDEFDGGAIADAERTNGKGEIHIEAWDAIHLTRNIDATGSANIFAYSDITGAAIQADELVSVFTGRTLHSPIVAGGRAVVTARGDVLGSVHGATGADVVAMGAVAGIEGNVAGPVTTTSPTGDVRVKAWGELTGDITAGRHAYVDASMGIHSNISGGGHVDVQSGATIEGDIHAGSLNDGTMYTASVMALGTGNPDEGLTGDAITGDVSSTGHVAVESFGGFAGNVTAATGNAVIAVLDGGVTTASLSDPTQECGGINGDYQGAVTAGGNVAVTVAGNIQGATIDAGGNAELTSHCNISDVTVPHAGEAVQLSADGKVGRFTVTTATDVEMGAVEGFTDTNVTATHDVSVVSHAGAELTVKAGNVVSVRTAQDLMGTIEGDYGVNIQSLGGVSGLPDTESHDAGWPSDEEAVHFEANSQLGHVSIDAHGGVDAQVTAKQGVLVDSLQDITGSYTSESDDVSLSSLESITGVTVTADQDTAVRAAHLVSGTVTSSHGNATVVSAASKELNSSTPDPTDADVSATVTALRDATAAAYAGKVTGAVTATEGDALVRAQGDITQAISAGGEAVVSTIGDLGGAATVTADGDVLVRALGNVDGDVTSQFGAASVVAGVNLTGNVTAKTTVEADAMTGNVDGDVLAMLGDAFVSAGQSVHGDVTGQRYVVVSALDHVTGNVRSNDASVRVSAGGGNIAGTIHAAQDADVFAYGDIQQTIDAGENVGVLTMGSPLQSITGGRHVQLVAYGEIPQTATVQAGGNASVWSFGDIGANVTAAHGTSTGDAVVNSWGQINTSVSTAGSALIWSADDAIVDVTSGGSAVLATHGAATIDILSGEDAYVWSGNGVSGTIDARIFAGLISLNHSANQGWPTNVNISTTVGDVSVRTLDNYAGTVNAGRHASIVSLNELDLGDSSVGGDLVALSFGGSKVSADVGGFAVATSLSRLNADLDGDQGVYLWSLDGMTGSVGSRDGSVFGASLAEMSLNMRAAANAVATARLAMVANVTGADNVGLWSGHDINGAVTADSSLWAASGTGDVGLTTVATGRDVHLSAAVDILGQIFVGRDLELGAYGQIDTSSVQADRDIHSLLSVGDLDGIFSAGREITSVRSFGQMLGLTLAAGQLPGSVAGRIGTVTANGPILGTFTANQSIDTIRSGAEVTVEFPLVGADAIIQFDAGVANEPAPKPPEVDLAQIVSDTVADMDLAGIVHEIDAARAEAVDIRGQIIVEKSELGDELFGNEAQNTRGLKGEQEDQNDQDRAADAQQRQDAITDEQEDLDRLRDQAFQDDAQRLDEAHQAKRRMVGVDEQSEKISERQRDIDRGQQRYEESARRVVDRRDAAQDERIQFYVDQGQAGSNLDTAKADALKFDVQFTQMIAEVPIVGEVGEEYLRLRQTYDQAVTAGFSRASAWYQVVGVGFYDVTGAMGIYRAASGQDPVTLRRLTVAERIFDGAIGAASLATVAVAGSRSLAALRGPCGGYIFTRCFVGETEILVDEHQADDKVVVAEAAPNSSDSSFGYVETALVGIGLGGAVAWHVSRRRQRKRDEDHVLERVFADIDFMNNLALT